MSDIEKDWTHLHHESMGKVMIPGLERAVLWDIHDEIPVHNYIRQLQELELEIRHCKTRYPELYRKLKTVKHNVQAEFEGSIDRIWNDQKSGTVFRNGERFEPHQVVKVHNLVLWDGLTTFTELISQETGERPDYMAEGTGTLDPSFADQIMQAEIARIDINFDGDINSDGIVLKWTGAFPTGIPSATISEFGAFDKAVAGRMCYHVVIDKSEDRLGHVQGRTIVHSSHSIEFNAVKNK